MMRNFKKFLAVVCSLTLVAGSTVTAFAEAPTSGAGTGNVLYYSIESVIVPTSIQIALNPQAYTITKKAATVAADATYEAFAYSENADDEQKEAEFKENKGYLFTRTGEGTEDSPYAYHAATAFDKTATYYKEETPATTQAEAVTSADQIVSFNYGLANFSTADKDVKVSFTATGDVSNAAGKQAITFVDDIKKAQAYDASSNTDGAKVDELKMYLAVVAAKELPKLDSSKAFAITPVTGGKDITNVTAKALADISMEKAANNAGAVAFEAGTGTTIAKADIAFKLGKAVYQIRDYDTLGWDTTQEDLAKMTEIKTLGDITGFTFIGAMNPNVDWTTANVTALTFTPTYEVSKTTDTEVSDGGYKQIKTTPAAYTVTYNANYVAEGEEEAATATETVNADAHPKADGEEVVALKTREGYTFKFWGTSATATEAADLDEISSATTLYAIWDVVPTAGFATIVQYQGEGYLALKGESGAAFENNATSVIVNDVDVTEYATLITGCVAVKGADLIASGVTVATGTKLTAVYVVDGVTYKVEYTPGS